MKNAVLALLLLTSCGRPLTGCGTCGRPLVCRTSCTTATTYVGCCPCPTGSFDDYNVCLPDGGMRDGG